MSKYHKHYTYEEIHIAALEHTSRMGFKENNRSAYGAAQRRGILNDVCMHMLSLSTRWTRELVLEEALKFDLRNDFRTGSRVAYLWACHNGILDLACSHMLSFRTEANALTNKKGIYLLYNKNELVYIGKSSSSIGGRINDHRKSTKEFDTAAAYLIESDDDINVAEVYLICKHKPKYNKDNKSESKLTIEIDNLDSIITEIIEIKV